MDESEKHIELISKYLKSELNDRDRKKVENMLDSGKEFRKMYELIKTLHEQGTPDELTALADPLKEMSLDMFRQYHGAKDKDKKLLGLPVYDSRAIPLPDGVRPSLTGARRLRYKFEDMEIELSLNPITLYSFEIIGQIDDGTRKRSYKLELVGDDQTLSAETDELQMFAFNKVPAMKYRLGIFYKRKKIGIIDIDLC